MDAPNPTADPPPGETATPAQPMSLAWSWGVIAFLVLMLPVLWLGLRHVELKNDVESWLPADDPNAIALSWYHEHFEHNDRMLVSWDSATLDDPRIEAFAEAALEVPGVVSSTTPNEVVELMRENRIDRDTALRRLRGVLVGTGLLKVRLTETGRARKDELLQAIIDRAVEELGFPLRVDDAAWTEGDSGKPYDFRLSWDGIGPTAPRTTKVLRYLEGRFDEGRDARAPLVDAAFFEAGSPVAVTVAVEPDADGDGVEDEDFSLKATVNGVREAAISVGVSEEELRMAGSPVGANGLNQAVLKSALNPDVPVWKVWRRSPVALSAFLGVLLAYVMLRSARLATLVLLVAIYTVLATVALVHPTGGSMSMVLVVMPNLLLVLTMSGAIHLANYWKHEAHLDQHASVARAVQLARTPCGMASFTTAVGLASLMTSVLTPVKDFGLYSAIGCGVSLFMVLVGMAAMLRVWPGRPGAASKTDEKRWAGFGRFLVRHHRMTTLLCLTAFALGVYGLRYFRTETKVIRYFPDDSRIVQDYTFLEENLSGIVPVTVVVGFHGDEWGPADLPDQIQLIRSVAERLASHQEISGTLSLADFVPPEPGADASRRERILYNRKVSAAIEEQATAEVGGSTFVTRAHTPLVVSDRGREVAFRPPAPDEDGDIRIGQEVWKITSQVAIMSDLDYGPFLEQVDSLVEQQLESFRLENGGEGRTVNYLVTGTVPLFLRTQEAVLESLIRSFGLAFALIAVVMMCVLRSVRSGLLTMLPNLLPVAVVFGLVSWVGIRVDIGTMITASVALGVAVDGTLHMLSWFREQLGEGKSREEAIALGLSHCGPAMWQTSAAVGIGMLALLGAELLLVSRFGWLMAALILAALIADLVFLPSLLAGPLGRMIERRVVGRGDESSPDDQASLPKRRLLKIVPPAEPENAEHQPAADPQS